MSLSNCNRFKSAPIFSAVMIFSQPRLTSCFRILFISRIALAAFVALQTSSFVSAGRLPKDSAITLAELYKELRGEPDEFLQLHLQSMLTVTGVGDRLYTMAEDSEPSTACVAICEATTALTKQLSLGKEADDAQTWAVEAAVDDVKETKILKHPLEFVCQRLEKEFAEKPSLKDAFERLKKSAPKSSTGSRPAAYARELFTAPDKFLLFMLEKLTVPGICNAVISEVFSYQLNETKAFSRRHQLFAVSVVAMARKAEFAEKLQSLYEKAKDDIFKEITTTDYGGDERILLSDGKTLWFLPRFVKKFYDYIAADESLKDELDSTAAILGKNFDKTDIEFSKF